MHLPDRGGGDGFRVPGGEGPLRRLAQLFRDDLRGQFRAHRRHAVLQPAQRPAGGGGQAVVDVAGHLAQLHQHALHRPQGGGDVLGGLQRQVVPQRFPVLTRAGEEPGRVARVPRAPARRQPQRRQPALDPQAARPAPEQPPGPRSIAPPSAATAAIFLVRDLSRAFRSDFTPFPPNASARRAAAGPRARRVRPGRPRRARRAPGGSRSAAFGRQRRRLGVAVHLAGPVGQRRDRGVPDVLPQFGDVLVQSGRVQQVAHRFRGRGRAAQLGADAGDVPLEGGHAVRDHLGRDAEQFGRDGHLGHVGVGVRVRQRRAEQGAGGQARIHQGGVHPQQQRGVAGRVWLAGHRVHAADMGVDGLHPLRDPPGAGPVPERDRDLVGRGGREPADRIRPPVAVLVDAGHRQRVQRLQQQRTQPRDRRGQVGADPPGYARGPEEPVVFRRDRHR